MKACLTILMTGKICIWRSCKYIQQQLKIVVLHYIFFQNLSITIEYVKEFNG